MFMISGHINSFLNPPVILCINCGDCCSEEVGTVIDANCSSAHRTNWFIIGKQDVWMLFGGCDVIVRVTVPLFVLDDDEDEEVAYCE